MTELTCSACDYGVQLPVKTGLVDQLLAQIQVMQSKRKSRKVLINLPDYLLKDVGLTQDDIAQERVKSWLL